MSLRAHKTIISGYAARLPGANSVDDFWSLLSEGRCSVTQVTADRFSTERFLHPLKGAAGRSFTFAAGQIDDVWGFDAGFFGISPREAAQIDPQQRLLLQTVWEALEDAGLKPSDLAGSETGVYVGASGLDYHQRLLFDMPAVDMQSMTGNTLSIVSNRISYIFDLRGPSFTLDTACSSSLVALHQAVSAIESGQIDTAIVAGVNLLLSPFSFIGFARASMLSPQGLCRAFDASGDGYVRSEGAVAMVLRRDDADPSPRARIVATGINADGRTAGLSLPSASSQAVLLDALYHGLEIDPNDLAFIEAHGTGTQVGDPAEASALGSVVGRSRSAPLPIGSVKTNVGHLEPVSGLVGVLKSVLALRHDTFPRSLHFDEPNPNIDFADLNLEVAAAPVALERKDTPRLAGINSFGFGGTNAHAIVSDGADVRPPQSTVPDTAPLVLSARSEAALKDLARRYATCLDGAPAGVSAGAISDAAVRHRDLLEHRLIALGTAEEKRAALRAHADDTATAQAISGKAAGRTGRIAFAFSGNGSQWAGMGQAAYQTEPVFRRVFEAVDKHFMAESGWSLVTMLFSGDLDTEIERTEIAQPLLFALQVALASALRERGVEASAVVGHSVGEVAAAWYAGLVDLKTATSIIHARSTQQEVVRHLGGMAALLLAEDDARAALAEAALPGLELSAVNSPRSVTLSGPSESIDVFARLARKKKWALRKLTIAYPFHSALVDPIEAPLKTALGTIAHRQGGIAFLSSVHPEAEAIVPDADYWWENVRRPVRFADAVQTLAERHPVDLVVEIGPKPVLLNYVRDTLRAASAPAPVLATFDKPKTDAEKPDSIEHLVARIVAHGATPDFDRLVGPAGKNLPPLPHYPWQTVPYVTPETGERLNVTDRASPLAGARLRDDDTTWYNLIDTDLLPFLADHKVEEATVFPAAGFVEMALRAALDFTGTATVELCDFEIVRPLLLEAGKTVETRIRLSADDRVIEICSRPRLADADWSMHAQASFRTLAAASDPQAPSGAPGETITQEAIYALTEAHGLFYGPAFRLASTTVLRGERQADVTLAPPCDGVDPDRFALHPALADAGFHGLFALLAAHVGGEEGTGFLPVRFGAIELHAAQAVPTRVEIVLERASPRSIVATFDYRDDAGVLVARLRGARFRAVQFQMAQDGGALAYRLDARLLSGDAGEATPAPADVIALARDAGIVVADADAEGFQPADEPLLLDALARTIVHRSLAEVLGSGPTPLAAAVADGRLAETAVPFAGHFLHELAQQELAEETPEGWRLLDLEEALDPDDLVQSLFAGVGAHGPEATLLARLADDLPDVLRAGLPDRAPEFFAPGLYDAYRTDAPGMKALADGLAGIARRVIDDWPAHRPLAVLMIGADQPALAQTLAAALPQDRAALTVTDATRTALDRAQRQWHGRPDTRFVPFEAETLAEAGPFDLVIACNALTALAGAALSDLARALAGDALLVAAEPAPTLSADLIHGIGHDWWTVLPGTDFAFSARQSGADWAKTLQAGPFDAVETASLDGALIEASLVAARPRAVAQAPQDPAARANGAGREDQSADTSALLVLSDADGHGRAVARSLKRCLEERGLTAALAEIGGETAVTAAGDWTLDLDDPDLFTQNADLQAACAGGVIDLTGAFRDDDALAAVGDRTWTLTRLLTRCGARAGQILVVAPDGARAHALSRTPDPVQAAIWAYGRVAINEFPDVTLRLLDPGRHRDPSAIALRIAAEIDAADATNEREIVLDGDRRLGLRLDRRTDLPVVGAGAAPTPALRLEMGQQGLLDRLAWRDMARAPLQGDEIEIAVEATGLNFRDVMWALGLLPEEALEDGFAGPTLGMECCGRVVALGPDATDHAVGDRVIAFAPACFATHVRVSQTGCVPVPGNLPAEAAATIPVAFLTSYYALVHLAALQPKDTVLIHGGAGGVGLAAIQIARHVGARIIATAGSAEKRSLLRRLGVAHVLDSRSLAFADDIRRLTGGAGVDVVLNSLSGEAMERSIDVLKPFGRFLELGKRDFYANTHLGLRPFRQNLSYFGIDADQLLVHQPALAQRLLRELMALFEDETLVPLPYRDFDADDAVAAFRLMQQAGHIGKIVIRPPETVEAPETLAPVALDAQAAMVVIGGFGGFGAALIRRLADMGARTVAVLSRRGAAADGAADLIAEMAARGVTVTAHACDATDEVALSAALANVRAKAGSIGGVFHTAMVLDDMLIANLDRAAIDRVLAPKVRGAELLDRLTRQDALAHFVLFSSATTLVGNPGQANYVAANGYLEGLAARRRAEGLPGLAVAWGAISDAGYLARNAEVGDKLARKLGRHALSAREALDGLARLMAEPQDDVKRALTGYARIDWAAARRDLALLGTGFAERLGIDGSDDSGGEAGAIDLAALLEGLDRAGAIEKVCGLLATEIGRILRIDAAEIEPGKPLTDVGMDSLMALELRMAAERQFGIDIPLMSLANGATLADMAARIVDQVLSGETGPALSADAKANAMQHLGEDALSDANAETLQDVAARVEEKTKDMRSLL